MKKILYIFLIALLGATACNLHEQTLNPAGPDGTVTFVMGVEFPEGFVATRAAMDTDPIIDDIHVAVFGDKGYLNDYVQTIPVDVVFDEDGKPTSITEKTSFSDIQNGVVFYYKVTLRATTNSCTAHVIANGPKKINFSYDFEVMPNLTTDAGQGAYWTMFSLPNGTAVKDPATGYDIPSPAAENAFRNLKLIRNFAKVTVTNSASNFELEGYKVFNTPAKGRIVTWKADYIINETDKDGEPVIDEETGQPKVNRRLTGYYTPYVGAKDDPSTTDVDESTAPMTFTELRNAKYTPTQPEGVSIDSSEPTTSMEYRDEPQFVFEREMTNGANRPYIILKGKFDGSQTSTYYRLDFTDKNGNYIPIFRNFRYDINIGSVAKAGVADPKTAQPSNANVSALISAHSLTDLADGTSRIMVQKLDYTFITAGPTKFPYIYMKDARKPIAEANVSKASFRILTNDELKEIKIDEEDHTMPLNTDLPAFTTTYADNTDWGSTWNSSSKWYEVILNIAEPGNEEKRTTFRLTGTTADGDLLYRDVTIHVLQKQTFNAKVNTSASSGSAVGSTVTVDLTLASNLPSSIFPLEIAFEDSDKRLNPKGIDMPARVQNSMVQGKTGERSYQFVKSISYAEYTASNVISCVFQRISAGPTTLYMENEYFNSPSTLPIANNY